MIDKWKKAVDNNKVFGVFLLTYHQKLLIAFVMFYYLKNYMLIGYHFSFENDLILLLDSKRKSKIGSSHITLEKLFLAFLRTTLV